jgi:hypothetical protein
LFFQTVCRSLSSTSRIAIATITPTARFAVCDAIDCPRFPQTNISQINMFSTANPEKTAFFKALKSV